MKILQINCNRSIPAQHMALATARNLKAEILLISEPNKRSIRDRKDWFYDEDQNTAIKIIDTNIPIRSQGQGTGFTYIAIEDFVIFSCYSSGNDSIQTLEGTLLEIGNLIRTTMTKAVISGDFNAKSPLWGMNFTDERGKRLTEWIAELNLVVANKGSMPTFQIENYGSILDLTIVTEKMGSEICQWEVRQEESLSDHNYILFEINKQPKATRTLPKEINRGWQIKKVDNHRLQSMAVILKDEPDLSAGKYTRSLAEICNNVMPKKNTNFRRKPVYWWSDEIAELRKECLKRRRAYTRSVRRNPLWRSQQLWNLYKISKKTLRNKIKQEKRNCWKRLCLNVDIDIWGDGYKIAMKGLLGFPPRVCLPMEKMSEVIAQLFPTHTDVIFDCDPSVSFTNFTTDELQYACEKLKNNKAPGPGNIPPEIVKAVALYNPNYVLSIYNKLAKKAIFPIEWKQAKLVLLRKGNKSLDDPSSFRPICLLDVEGKLYEQLLVERLNKELKRTGDLSEQQYGFRKGRQTVDAINKVISIARETEAHPHTSRKLCAVITVDVKNAFNSASWQLILEELRRRRIEESLISIIRSYLSQRQILLEAEDTCKTVKIYSGVPQGSILGPTLWNILYDDLFKIRMPDGITLVGFADDVAIVATAKTETLLMDVANIALLRVSNWMQQRRLALAPEKTEAVLLTKRRKIQPITFSIHRVNIKPCGALKYLGVWLDTKLNFKVHVNKTVQKAEKTTNALTSLMPNIGGPVASKRRILCSVIHSQMLYAAPAWHTVTTNKKVLQNLISLQRKLSIRICSAYRTISTEAVGVIAGVLPIELQIIERKERYDGIGTSVAKDNAIHSWQLKWETGRHGRWTHRLIPDIARWIDRSYGEPDYYLSQALSGHGCFTKYLYGRRRAETPNCVYCDKDDDAEHTLFVCPRWHVERMDFLTQTNRAFDLRNMMESLLAGEERWNHAYFTIRTIIQTKEREARTER